jgi:hypothetical protein
MKYLSAGTSKKSHGLTVGHHFRLKSQSLPHSLSLSHTNTQNTQTHTPHAHAHTFRRTDQTFSLHAWRIRDSFTPLMRFWSKKREREMIGFDKTREEMCVCAKKDRDTVYFTDLGKLHLLMLMVV